MTVQHFSIDLDVPGSEVMHALATLSQERTEADASRFYLVMAQLCQSPCLWVMDADGQVNHVGLAAEMTLDFEACQEQARQLREKLEGRPLVYEPCRVQPSLLQKPYLYLMKFRDGALALLLDHHEEQRFHEMIVRSQLIKHLPLSWEEAAKAKQAEFMDDRVLDVLKVFDLVLSQKQFKLAVLTFVNDVAQRWGATRVSLGWKKGSFVELMAISQMESFDHYSAMAKDLKDVFEETADQELRVMVSKASHEQSGEDLMEVVNHQHQKLLRKNDLQQVFSLPMVYHDQVVAVVCVEMAEKTIDAKLMDLAEITVHHVCPWLEELRLRERWWFQRLRDSGMAALKWCLGPRHTLMKASALLLSCLLFCSVFMSSMFYVEATGALETDQVAFISAPFHGYVKKVGFHSGDPVSAGQVLLEMDQEEMLLKQLEEQANALRFSKEAEKYRSKRDLVSMKVAQARLAQAEAELQRIDYYLNLAKVKSNLDGIVVEGSKEELQGAPVSKGDLLLKVVNPTELYVSLKVNERDVDHLKEGAKAHMVLLSQPGKEIALAIDKWIPVAQADSQEGNVFTLKASLRDELESWWRPGMSGVVKIEVAEKPWIWLLFHRTVDSLRYSLWL